jgi:hypothetical protein
LVTWQNERLRQVRRAPCAGEVDRRKIIACFQRPEHRLKSYPASDDTLVAEIVKDLARPVADDTFADDLKTTADVYNAVFTLLEAWSARSGGTRVFINASWTASNTDMSAMPAIPRIGGHVRTVAAAGNEGTVVRPGQAADFVLRAFEKSGDFVLVENRRRSGLPMCSSTRLNTDDVSGDEALVFHFGLVRGRTVSCGSSFAAPRVAWTLAFGETIRAPTCGLAAEAKRREAAQKTAAARKEPWRWPYYYLASASGKAPLLQGTCP